MRPFQTARAASSFNSRRSFHVGAKKAAGILPHPMIRMLALIQVLLLFFSGSSQLLAVSFSAGMRASGSGSQAGGGQGSSPNLQNAGAASAALTAALAKKSLEKSQAVINGLTTAQQQAAAFANANPNNGTVAGKAVINGLQLSTTTGSGQAPGLVPYYGNQPAPTGPNIPAGSVPVPGTWSGVASLSQTISGSSQSPSSATVTITQNQQSAFLYWNSFNVGPKTTVNFNQIGNNGSPGSWIAFNKVMTANNPSQIFGKINSPGQVYILNQNGILFHAGSEINVQSLVAATLPVNPNLAGDPLSGIKAGRGLANNPDYQFLFSALPVSAGKIAPTAAWNPVVNSPIGDVVVESGAQIKAAVNAEHSGGLVALVAPNVENQGTISTPNGQTVLAAGLQVGMKAHPTADPSLRGLDFYVGAVADPSVATVSVADGSITTGNTGTAKNEGLILIPEGNATMVGKSILQNAGIAGTTSVSFNGRIDLSAVYNTAINDNYQLQGQPLLYQSTGLVRIGEGATLQILPEWGSSATVTGTTLALNSLVTIQGKNVDFATGSIVEAPGAITTPGAVSQSGLPLTSGVTVQAGNWYDDGSHQIQFYESGGQIYLGPSSVIDVSGSTDVQVSSAQNFVTIQLRAAQLAGEALQNDPKNPIYGADLTVDIRDSGTFGGGYWIGTPLGDATGYAALVQRNVGQLTVNGGSVALQSGDSLVQSPGSLLNVSGGWVQYSGGTYAVSQLINSFGQTIPVQRATPDQLYTGIVKDPPAQYESPYVSGGNGGSIAIQAASVALDGSAQGTTVAGPRQLRPGLAGLPSTLPVPSLLSLAFSEQSVLNKAIVQISPYAPSVSFSAAPNQEVVPNFSLDANENPLPLPPTRQSSFFLDPALASQLGFGQISISNHDGRVTVPSSSSLQLGPGGELSISAADIMVAGGIHAPGGGISLNAQRVSDALANGVSAIGVQDSPFLDVLQDSSGTRYIQYGYVNADGNVRVVDANGTSDSKPFASLTPVNEGRVNLLPSAVLDVAAYLADDRPTQPGTTPVLMSGGSIQISGYNVSLTPGAMLSVSGGAYVSSKGSVTYGDAGSISISGGQDPAYPDMHGGDLKLGSTFNGFSGVSFSGGGKPGSLSLTAPAITLGADGAASGINLKPSFFDQGGFGTFSLTGIGIGTSGTPGYLPAITVSAGSVIDPKIQRTSIIFNNGVASLAPVNLPTSLGSAPNLSLNAKGIFDSNLGAGQQLIVRGDLVQEAGSQIVLRPALTIASDVVTGSAGALSLTGMTVEEKGHLSIPGGSVTIKGGASLVSNLLQNNPYVTVDLAPTASISVDGTALYTTDPYNIRPLFGAVLPGGTVSISGNLLARSGSAIGANGSSGVFSDLGSSGKISSYRSDSAGGSILLAGGQVLYSDASLSAAAGGRSASGGLLSVSSGNFQSGSVSAPSMILAADGISAPSGIGAVAQALPAIDQYGGAGGAHLEVSSFQNGGFDTLTLSGNLLFAGSKPISISNSGSIKAGTGGVMQTGTEVTLNSPVVWLGMPFQSPLAPSDSQLTTVLGTITDPLYAPPTYGEGKLQVNAGTLINVGNLSLQGIGVAALSAPKGEIRGDGNLVVAGELTLAASQIYPSTGTTFSIVAFNHDASGKATSAAPDADSGITAGSLTVQSSALTAHAPFSALGNLNLYASTIIQAGNLAAPFGRISLGSSSGAGNPRDPMSGLSAPDTRSLILSGGSITTVTGDGLVVPYGTSSDGSTWVDAAGTDITTLGLPAKGVSLSGQSVTLEGNSILSLQGGGDLKALDWVSGLGGMVNLLGYTSSSWSSSATYNPGNLVSYQGKTWSARQANSGTAPSIGPNWTLVPKSFAILPGYASAYAPTGYGDESVAIGSSVILNGSAGLPAGNYTLLPASYASLPGGYLLTLSTQNRNTQVPISTEQPDGTILVSGTLFNDLSQDLSPSPNSSLFLLSKPAVLSKQVRYQNLSASTFFASSGTTLPANGGDLTISASASADPIMLGDRVKVNASGSGPASGGLVALAAPGIFSIGAAGGTQIDPNLLNQWRYGGLLIGGMISPYVKGSIPSLKVSASSVTVGEGVSLTGSDIILAANQSVILLNDSSINSQGTSHSPFEQLSVIGNGAIVRVSDDPAATVIRTDVTPDSKAAVTLGQNVTLDGSSVMIDSSGNSSIDTTAKLNTASISLAAGSIALVLDPQPADAILGDLVRNDTGAMVVRGDFIQSIQNAANLALTSYSTLDLYGSTAGLQGGAFGSASMASLALQAGEIRGFDLNGGTAALAAQSIKIGNAANAASAGPVSAGADGGLELDAATITLGNNVLSIDQFAYASFNATGVVAASANAALNVGTASMPSDLFITTPLVTAAAGKVMNVTTSGDLVLQSPDPEHATKPSLAGGAGSSLNFNAPTIAVSTTLSSPSGQIALHATKGNVDIGGQGNALFDVSGTSKQYDTATATADAGTIRLVADTGDVTFGAGASLDLSARGSSSGGELVVVAPQGALLIDSRASLNGSGGPNGGRNGSFSMDVSTLTPGSGGLSLLSSVTSQLIAANLSRSLSFRIRSGDVNVDTYVPSHDFTLSADQGSIDVTSEGIIDASGLTGGSIVLQASGNVILEPNSLLTVHGDNYDAAGKGGAVILSAGAAINGAINNDAILDLRTGSAIDLGVTAAPVSSQDLGGVLHLRAPITADGSDVQIAHLDATIDPFSHSYSTVSGDTPDSVASMMGISVRQLEAANNLTASSILEPGTVLKSAATGVSAINVEGYQLYELEGTAPDIAAAVAMNVQGLPYTESQTVKQLALANAQNFFGTAGNGALPADALQLRLAANQPAGISRVLNLAPGVEIINRSGDLTLNQDWDFSTFRVSGNSVPGFLTLRASGNVTFNASLSDGFTGAAYAAALLPLNPLLPENLQSWAYQITAGADLSAASLSSTLTGTSGDVNLGVAAHGPITASGGVSAKTSDALGGTYASGAAYNYYQVIRTGTGNIAVSAAGNIRLWNQFASIYTVGSQVADPSLGGTFDTPTPVFTSQNKTPLGVVQQADPYPAQYSQAGGDIILSAGSDISHLTLNASGGILPDASAELPSNWLYRRGALDANGKFLQVSTPTSEIESTSWWVDFSNFFDGVGALGGGNVSLTAGGKISNIDAVIPTNYRMPGHPRGGLSPLQPDSTHALELGGGNLFVNSSGNLEAGVFYVENGNASLHAGGDIVTGSTRDPQLSSLINPSSTPSAPESYLPTTLFLGKGSVSVSAGGSIILGPVANAFLLPQGINNSFWYKTYFSTYDTSDQVSVLALGGDVTLRTAAYSPGSPALLPMLQLWTQDMVSPVNSLQNGTAAYYQPWLRLAESSVSGLAGLSLMPSSLTLQSFSGDIHLQGDVTLSPSPSGELQLLASGSIEGLTASGIFSGPQLWSSSTLNVSDAAPSSLPGASSPLAMRAWLPADQQTLPSANGKSAQLTLQIASLFTETGSTYGASASLQNKLALHDPSLLHTGDTTPLELFAGSGDISGLTLYSPKSARIMAGNDITDVGLYIQNIDSSDVSLVSAGRNMILYNASSPLQVRAQADAAGQAKVPIQAGDIQISGPGSLEVLAGGNVDLGNNPGEGDPTLNLGITSVGNSRNPALPFHGADIVVSAGVKLPSGLSSRDAIALDSFASSALNGSEAGTYLSDLSSQMAYSGDPLLASLHTAADFGPDSTLTSEEKARLEMQLFYIVLRDAGRNHADPNSPGFGSYTTAENAIQTLIGSGSGEGNIITWSQNVSTWNGGNINLMAPGGGITMGTINYKTAGSSVAPGIITESGGSINIMTKQDVSIGIGRIFTLKGGDIMIWSDKGNIAAGASSKTVQSAPPTRVLLDPQSALVEADLAGLATGGGIGTLETVEGIPPSSVDLVAPSGVIDAGDAGIRSSGNLHLAASAILNAANIQAGGVSVGVPSQAAPPAPVAAPPAAAPPASASTAAAASSSAAKTAAQSPGNQAGEEIPSVFSIDVLGYGGGDSDESDKSEDAKREADTSGSMPVQASL